MKLKVSFLEFPLLLSSATLIDSHLFLRYLDLIVVNLTYPERNREVQVYCFESLRDVVTGEIVDGFEIVMPADIRDFELNLYKLEIVQDNELLLRMPSLPHQMQYDSARRHSELNRMKLMCNRCQEAQEICVTDIDSAPSRKQKTLRLRFPEHVSLVNLVSIAKELPIVIQPYNYETTMFGNASNRNWVCNVSWKVASFKTRRKAQGSAVKSTTAFLSELFGTAVSMSND